jgi:hypothetical protein
MSCILCSGYNKIRLDKKAPKKKVDIMTKFWDILQNLDPRSLWSKFDSLTCPFSSQHEYKKTPQLFMYRRKIRLPC